MAKIAQRAAAVAGLMLLASTGLAQAPVAAGSLNCDVSAGFGVIIGSRRSMTCTFTPSQPSTPAVVAPMSMPTLVMVPL